MREIKKKTKKKYNKKKHCINTFGDFIKKVNFVLYCILRVYCFCFFFSLFSLTSSSAALALFAVFRFCCCCFNFSADLITILFDIVQSALKITYPSMRLFFRIWWIWMVSSGWDGSDSQSKRRSRWMHLKLK